MNRNLPLFGRPPFPHPTPHGAAHYVPILKTLLGEMLALKNIGPAVRERMTPLIEVDMRSEGTDQPPRASRLPGLPEELTLIFGTRPFFLDFPELTSGKKVRVGRGKERRAVPAVEYVMERCDQHMLNFVPVVRPDTDAGLANLFKEVSGDGRGACLRLPVSRTFRPNGLAEELNRLLQSVNTEPKLTDLLIDLQYIDPLPGYESRHLLAVLESLPNLGDWRSLIMVGTVIPQVLSGFEEDQITALDRHEWRFWKEVCSLGTVRAPTFGDYAIQHPRRPKGGNSRRMRANIRYSTPETVLIARGRSLEECGTEQYRELCARLVRRPEFRGTSYSWGDDLITRCAEGLGDHGDQRRWRGAGTSHHLQVMIEALSMNAERAPLRSRANTHIEVGIAHSSVVRATS